MIVPRVSEGVRTAISELFQFLLIAYLLLLLVEQFRPVIYGTYLNGLLGLVLILGVATVLIPPKTLRVEESFGTLDRALIAALAMGGAVLVWLKTGDLGALRWLISAASGLLVAFLGYLAYQPEKDEEPIYLELTRRKVLIIIAGLVVLAAILSFFWGLHAFRLVFGSVLVLFVPGYALSFVFFATREIDILERVALSVALSIAVVPLLVFYLNLVGVPVRWWSVLLVVALVTAGSWLWIQYNNKVWGWWSSVRPRRR